MSGRRGKPFAIGRRAAIVIALAGAVASVSAVGALAATERIGSSKTRAVGGTLTDLGATAAKKKKKKKKQGPAAATQSAPVAFASGTTVSAVASCAGKTHISGGGFGVSPSFTPPSTGLRSVTSTSHPTGDTTWNASGSAFSTPLASGSFTTYARCENNSLGKLAGILSSSVTLAPASAQTFTFNCPPGTHVLSGGYAGAGLGGFTYSLANLRIILLQSHRTGPGQWVVQALNSSNSPAASPVTGFALCERDARGRTISEASTFTALVNDARATGDPTCTGKTHAISGGFVISPNGVGTVAATAIDEFQPVGNQTWHVGLHELVNANLPPGSSLQSYAYCAPDTLPKQKMKKKRGKKNKGGGGSGGGGGFVDRDCSDFSTQAQAQAFFQQQGPGDPHNLDGDGDGIACEELP
jgi:hypothetical protein